jgi:hypothetical protein
MRRQVERGAEALDERDPAAETAAHTHLPLRSLLLIGEERAQKATQHLAHELGVPGAPISKRKGKREHPLPHGHLRQHAIDEAGGGVGHSPSAAGRTKAAPLAGEGHQPIVATAVAVYPQETVGQDAARELRAHRAFDEVGDGRSSRARAGGRERTRVRRGRPGAGGSSRARSVRNRWERRRRPRSLSRLSPINPHKSLKHRKKKAPFRLSTQNRNVGFSAK